MLWSKQNVIARDRDVGREFAEKMVLRLTKRLRKRKEGAQRKNAYSIIMDLSIVESFLFSLGVPQGSFLPQRKLKLF